MLSKFDKKLRKVKGKLKERSLSELELETLVYLEFNKFPKQLKRNIITNYEPVSQVEMFKEKINEK